MVLVRRVFGLLYVIWIVTNGSSLCRVAGFDNLDKLDMYEFPFLVSKLTLRSPAGVVFVADKEIYQEYRVSPCGVLTNSCCGKNVSTCQVSDDLS